MRHQPRSETTAILENLPAILAWQQTTGAATDLQEYIFVRGQQEANATFEKIAELDKTRGSHLNHLLHNLPDSGARRFLGAPETTFRLASLQQKAQHINFFYDSLTAERLLARDANRTHACWSALGDFYFAEKPSSETKGQKWESESDFAAPRIGEDSIPVDFISPYAQTINSIRESPFEPYASDEIAALCGILDEALSRIGRSSPCTAALIKTFTKVIVCRKESFRANRVGSSSTPSHIGRLLLRNGHSMDCGTLADALVHETIHAFLFSLERFVPLADASETKVFIPSPWSCNSLPPWIYFQACFVWYGLAHFWYAALKTRAFPGDIAVHHLTKALSGFKNENPSLRLHAHSDLISTAGLQIADGLQERIMGLQSFA